MNQHEAFPENSSDLSAADKRTSNTKGELPHKMKKSRSFRAHKTKEGKVYQRCRHRQSCGNCPKTLSCYDESISMRTTTALWLNIKEQDKTLSQGVTKSLHLKHINLLLNLVDMRMGVSPQHFSGPELNLVVFHRRPVIRLCTRV